MIFQLLAPRLIRAELRNRRIDVSWKRRRGCAAEELQDEKPSPSGRGTVGLRLAGQHRGLAQETGAAGARVELDLCEAGRRRRDAVDRGEVGVHERLIAVVKGPNVGVGPEDDVLDEELKALEHRALERWGEAGK